MKKPMQARIFSVLVLWMALPHATLFAQPTPVPPSTNVPTIDPEMIEQRRQELRRRFQLTTNNLVTRTNVDPQTGEVIVDQPTNQLPGAIETPPVEPPSGQIRMPQRTQPGALPEPIPAAPGTPPTQLPAPGSPGAIPGTQETIESFSANPVNPALDPNTPIDPGDVKIQGMEIAPFLDIYQLYSGRTVLRPYALQAPPGLTLMAQTTLTRRELIHAMDAVLALNNITMIPYGDKFVKAVPSALAEKEGAEISVVPRDEIPLAEQYITRIVKLETAKPTEIAPTLQAFAKSPNAITPIDSNQTIILRDYASNVKRMLEIIEKVDVMPESDFSFEVIPIKYGKVMDIYSSMSALISGGGVGAFGAGASPAGAAAFGTAGGFRGGGGGMMNRFGGSSSRFGGGGYNQYGNRGGYNTGYGGGYGGGSYYPQELGDQTISPMQVPATPSAGASQNTFQSRLRDIVNRAANPDEVKILENANIVPDERSNRLLIFANKRDMAMITNIVSKVDVLLAQVLIEAIILEVSVGDTFRLGVSAVQHPKQFGQDFTGAGVMNNGQTFLGNLTNFPGATPEGFNYFGRIGNDFDVVVNALAEDSEAKVISRPRIQTSHAIPGFFLIGQTVPYVTGFTDYGGLVGGGLSTRSSIQERVIALQLTVTPFITPEGMVVMEIDQTFDQRGEDVFIDENPVPVVNSRQAAAMLTVRNGDIIMLGGFISERNSENKSGVPFLKDIPGIGALFRRKNTSTERTELIILMKATVLESPEDAAYLADWERRMLPGVREAELEFEESERKRMRRIENR